MQGLFSIFPVETPGAALLVLRLSVAATLLVSGTAHRTLMMPLWMLLLVALPALCLVPQVSHPLLRGSLSCYGAPHNSKRRQRFPTLNGGSTLVEMGIRNNGLTVMMCSIAGRHLVFL